MTVTTFFQNMIAGIVVGSVYGLIALGYVTIYRCSGVVNFAQGVFVMLGALTAIELVRDRHMSYPLAAVIAIGGTSIVGLLVYIVVVDRVRTELVVSQLMATLGISMLIQGVMLVLGGGYPRTLPSFTSDKPWKLATVSIPQQGVWIILIAVVIVAILYLVNNRTMFGKKMTATATDPMAASLVGISRRAMISWAFIISAAIGSAGGLALAAMTPMNFASGSAFGFKGFIAAVLGGWGKSSGALVGGIALGIFETFGAAFLPSGYKDAIAFLLLLLVMYFRPSGLLGSSLVEEAR
jgi:branched-chain amino acid transport system permease protein